MSESKPSRRTSPPRPDQLSDEVIEFLTAIDLFKRQAMRSFLNPKEMFPVLESLGYVFEGAAVDLEQAFEEALDVLREESGRPFPNWSELYDVALELGWSR
jgi:hypothetical protein